MSDSESPTSRGLKLLSPGISATIQDSGRTGYRRHALAAAGALDLHAFYWANKLLDNPMGAPCLELVSGGLTAIAETRLIIALTGADTEIRVNDELVQQWQTLVLDPGDYLDIGHSRAGRLIYIAFAGGLKSPIWFGSHSIAPREKLTGLGSLEAGNRLIAAAETPQAPLLHKVPDQFIPDYSAPLALSLVPGYQVQQFTNTDLVRLKTNEYIVTQQSDRMGFRLKGQALSSPPPGIISEGIAIGSVQIPGDGQPIVLLNDCQTIGGYPKVGTIARLDCSRLAQRMPGQAISFTGEDISDVQNERRLFERFFQKTIWESNELVWV